MLTKNLMASLGALGAYLGFGNAPQTYPARFGRRPTGAQLRTPADPLQAARIRAAVAKRERKSLRLERNTMPSACCNHCLNGHISNLNPFYIAK